MIIRGELLDCNFICEIAYDTLSDRVVVGIDVCCIRNRQRSSDCHRHENKRRKDGSELHVERWLSDGIWRGMVIWRPWPLLTFLIPILQVLSYQSRSGEARIADAFRTDTPKIDGERPCCILQYPQNWFGVWMTCEWRRSSIVSEQSPCICIHTGRLEALDAVHICLLSSSVSLNRYRYGTPGYVNVFSKSSLLKPGEWT